MIDTQLQSNTAEHRVDFLELIQNSLHFLSFSLSFQTRIYQLLHIWFTGDSFGPALFGSRYKSSIILPGTLESVPSMWRPKCFHFSFRMEKKSSIGRKIGKNLEFVRDRFWCFDSSFLSHHVTAVTFRTTFYVWLTITVNNIVRKQDIKVNENVHKRIFCCCVEKCMQWITEIERDGMKNRLMEDKEECHWERDEEEIFMCKLRYTHTHTNTLSSRQLGSMNGNRRRSPAQMKVNSTKWKKWIDEQTNREAWKIWNWRKKSEQKKGRKDDLIVVAHKHIAFWMRFLAEDMNGTWSELIDE